MSHESGFLSLIDYAVEIVIETILWMKLWNYVPFAKIGLWMSRTFPRIGNNCRRTSFKRGVNCKASNEWDKSKF